MEFHSAPDWVASDQARPLSLSLPMNLDGLPIKGEKVGFFFDNLLPDSDRIRQRVRARFHTRSGDAFDLLHAIGRDCVGALQLLPEDSAPEGITEIRATRLNEAAIEKLLLGVTSDPASMGVADDDSGSPWRARKRRLR